ncbi:hypothetical protein PO909_028059 [Leuciscus waleckii]
MEGDSVILHNNVSEIPQNHDIELNFGANNSLIAKILRKKLCCICNVLDGRFRDRLKLDNKTGSLIITNTTTEHTGVYQLLISGAKQSSIRFNVSVYVTLLNVLHLHYLHHHQIVHWCVHQC